MKELELICGQCPLSECNDQSLWCAFSWITNPNINQKRLRANYRKSRLKQVRERRLQYFKDRYRLRKQMEIV